MTRQDILKEIESQFEKEELSEFKDFLNSINIHFSDPIKRTNLLGLAAAYFHGKFYAYKDERKLRQKLGGIKY